MSTRAQQALRWATGSNYNDYSEDTISWTTLGLVCGRRWAGISTPALQPDAPRPSNGIGDRVLYTFGIIPGLLKPQCLNFTKFSVHFAVAVAQSSSDDSVIRYICISGFVDRLSAHL